MQLPISSELPLSSLVQLRLGLARRRRSRILVLLGWRKLSLLRPRSRLEEQRGCSRDRYRRIRTLVGGAGPLADVARQPMYVFAATT